MERQLMVAVVAAALVAGLVAAGTSYVVVSPLVKQARGPAQDGATAPPVSNNTAVEPAAPGANASAPAPELPVWALVAQPNPQGRSVAAILSKVRGDANLSAANGSIEAELAGVNWTAFSLRPPPNGTILQALNIAFNTAPPAALARGALSRAGDGLELTVPAEAGVASVILHAPATGEFVVIDWPSGRPYAWNVQDATWVEVTEGPPSVLARPLPSA